MTRALPVMPAVVTSGSLLAADRVLVECLVELLQGRRPDVVLGKWGKIVEVGGRIAMHWCRC